ncbi:MAG: ribonuclease HII [Candidatus Marinimicrobia bacterium]|nr:ribonuclease HII [Candidatus Neomarinimicrobiota bacterium]
MLKYEYKYWNKGLKYIAGIDEAGRGPLAGPVVAACVILTPEFDIEGINDSKKLTAKKRLELFALIKEHALDVSIGIANEIEIDDLNILQATFLAMKRAVGNLRCKPDHLLIDGPYSDIKLISKDNIIKGDSLSLSIASASIIAKVERDRIMSEYHNIYPDYKFDKHKGYGTKFHIEALKEFKATPIHRKSFKIVKSYLPDYSFYKKTNSFNILASRIVAINFIKRNYTLENQNLLLNNNEKIDFVYTNSIKKVFIKVLFQLGAENMKIDLDVGLFLSLIDREIKEKESKKTKWFNVILVKFIPNNKPKIVFIYNEKIS